MAINPNTVNILNIDELNNASSIGNDDLLVIGQGIYARKSTVYQLYQKFGLENLENAVFELQQNQSNTDLGSVLRYTEQPLQESEQLTARSNINATDRRLEELASDLTANEKETIKTKLGITNGGNGEIRSENVISGMPIATASLLELSFLDLYSNKYVAPTNANVGNRICVKMAGADFGYTNGVIDIEDLPTADKVQINDNLGNGVCVAVLIFDESNGTVEQTEVLSPYGIYLHMANNPGERAIRIGNFFRESGRLFFDVNPGII